MKSGGFISTIVGLVLIAFLIAAARMFNWDVVALGAWVVDKVLTFIMSVSDYFFNSPTFRQLF